MNVSCLSSQSRRLRLFAVFVSLLAGTAASVTYAWHVEYKGLDYAFQNPNYAGLENWDVFWWHFGSSIW